MNCIYCGNSQDDEFCFNRYCPYDDKIIKEHCDGRIFHTLDQLEYDPTDPRDKRYYAVYWRDAKRKIKCKS